MKNKIPKWNKDKSILIVEDEETNLAMFVAIVKKCGLTVLTATNGLEAIDVIKKTPVDLILMDLLMKDMDGLETSLKLRDMGIDTPIIAMSGTIRQHDKNVYIRMGITDQLPKPLRSMELFEKIRKYLGPPISDDMVISNENKDSVKFIKNIPLIDFKYAEQFFTFSNPFKKYIDQLHKFKEVYISFRSEFYNDFFVEKNFDKCMFAMHDIKNFSGLIGCKKIHNAARVLQIRCMKKTENEETNKMVLTLFDDLITLLNDLERYLPQKEPPVQNDVLDVLDELKDLSSDNDYNTLSFLEENEDLLRASFSDIQIDMLKSAIENYAYEETKMIINGLI